MTTARSPHVVIVDDDPEIRGIVRDVLQRDGYRVSTVGDGEALLAMLRGHHPDLIILDLMLPGIQGLDVLRRVQEQGRVPTIVLSGKGSETDRVVGLEMGADDYLAKPFSQRELLARVHAVLRRASAPVTDEVLDFGGLRIDLRTREVVVDGTPVDLTALEFDLLVFLASAPRQVFSRETLLDRVWGSSAEWQTTATVSEHIHRLRRKVEADPARPKRIETLRGAGYRFTGE
jgi:two-component system alkaline phosphatase synthesis response regulator PhoP